MTITFKEISYEDFLSINGYLDWVHPTYHNQNPRKDWQSNYDPKFTKGTRASQTRAVVPCCSTLPSKRWVAQRIPEGSTAERHQWSLERDRWLAEQKLKYQMSLVMVDDEATWVHLFKKINDAVMFKLAWG